MGNSQLQVNPEETAVPNLWGSSSSSSAAARPPRSIPARGGLGGLDGQENSGNMNDLMDDHFSQLVNRNPELVATVFTHYLIID